MEIWRPIVGWEDSHEVSDQGGIRTIGRYIDRRLRNGEIEITWREGIPRKTSRHVKSGHVLVSLREPGRACTYSVHRLMLEAFVGPCPPGLEGCHNNGIPHDNRLENVRWDTRGNNVLDSVKHGTNVNAAKTHCKRNHPLSGDNLRMEGNRRRCRACAAIAVEKWKAKQL